MTPINPTRIACAADPKPRPPMPLPKVLTDCWRNSPACATPRAAKRWVKPAARPAERPASVPLAAAADPQWCPACGRLCVRRLDRVRCLYCGDVRYLGGVA